MKTGEIIGLLYFGGIAFLIACGIVLAQAFFFDFEYRLGRRLMMMVPPIIVLGAMALVVFSARNLRFLIDESTPDDFRAVWVTRLITTALLAVTLARVIARWRDALRAPAGREPVSPNRVIYIAFVAFFLGDVVFPMAFSAHPAFGYKGLHALVLFTAAYMSRKEPIEPVITTARWSLLIMMFGSLLAAVVKPDLALEPHYSGGLPGLHSRLWGLAPHANGMGALSMVLMLLQSMQPSPRKWLNAVFWMAALAVFVLAQSKTVWIAGILIWVLLMGYRHGRAEGGGLKIGFVLMLVLPVLLLSGALLFLDVGHLIDKFDSSQTGANAVSFTGRTQIWAAAFQMWLDSPMFGYGPSAWSLDHRMKLGLPFAVHAHNQFMQSLSVGGLVAAVTLMVYFVLLTRGAFRAAKRTRGISLAFLLFVAMRCVSEAPMDVTNLLSEEVLTQLLMFMLVINEAPVVVASVKRKVMSRFDLQVQLLEKGLAPGVVLRA